MSVELLELPEVEKLAPITKVETEIARMQKEYSGLTINGQSDKEGFAKVVSARKDVKAVRVQVEKERKALVDDAVKWQSQVNEAAKGIKNKLVAIEEPLQQMEDDYLAEKERVKQEFERKRKEKIQNRVQVIMSVSGVNFNGATYSLGKFRIDQSELEVMADSDFQSEVEILEAEYQIILEEKLAAEQAAKEEADRLEAQRKEQEAAAAEIKRQQEEIAAERKRLDDEKAAHEAALKREQEAQEAEARRVQAEADQKAAEEKRLAELEAAKAEAAEQARIAAELKAKQEAEAKAEAERITKEKEARKLARRPDMEKFNDMIAQLIELAEKFEFKTMEGNAAKNIVLQSIQTAIAINPLIKAE